MKLRSPLVPIAGIAVAALALAGCASADPLAGGEGADDGDDGGAIVIGSQDYYSNEIVAEIYAQALEAVGYEVQRDFRIGQREVYLPEIEAGSIDLFPEYSGPVLQYWEPDTEARLPDDVYHSLVGAMPEGLRPLDQAPATDQDAYAVTRAFAEEWNLTTIADLANVTVPLTLGANSEAESRPNGPQGLASAYGVEAGFAPIEDGGGPLTVKALEDGDIQLAIVYTSDPSIAENDLVVLEDPEGLFLASHIVPLASERVDDEAAEVINALSAQLTADELIALNARSVNEELPAATIATDWLAEHGA
ncbi:glycine/betaine ABC transporter permease [Pseudoclavibacter endophyticus]|uniref:ABC transporter substrate-binding protein n=1 Tax=Pseudoclavibacter endophyticus TaxID=1778590 RepID=A0A6H9WR57_9MICO|nr:ABC transporter substrate-binding protein [Pseudoclavibacter endophyticus]KAB1649265.1 ABC transporter substrate-binding protein [Pseudoclavibacter endophyticus]GGA64001.1 glycine/betaine ABC transporter permease [Pseudoclavibacter endophyticus]